jgi:hypothetical protein
LSKYLTKKSEKSLQHPVDLHHSFVSDGFFIFALLRSFIVILLSLAYLMVTTEFHEILRIPSLIEHYQEHSQKAEKLSFFEFINEHYFHSEGKATSTENHKTLPFHHDDLHIPILWVEEISHPELIFTQQMAILDIVPSVDGNFYSKCGVSDIWQPPRC